jgi:hypothetical protein
VGVRVLVHGGYDGAGHEGAENALQAESLREEDESDQE